MIEQTAVVIRNDGEYALVEAERKSSCGSCHAKQGCGTGMLEKSLGRRAMRMTALNQCHAQIGDEVIVAVPEKGFIKSAFFTYFLPLLLMLIGAVIAQQLDWPGMGIKEDFGALAGAIAGFIIAMLLLRQYARKIEKDPQSHPIIIRKADTAIPVDFRQFRKEQQPF